MSLLSYNKLVRLVEDGILQGVKPEHINAASIDITLGPIILEEIINKHEGGFVKTIVSLEAKESPGFRTINLATEPKNNYILRPGQFILAQSAEVFHLPDNIACEYKLKSSMARIGLDHMLAGWCDPGFNNSVLTLEFRNMLTYHDIEIKLGNRIGQLVFYEVDPVPKDRSYATVGSYNGNMQTTGVSK